MKTQEPWRDSRGMAWLLHQKELKCQSKANVTWWPHFMVLNARQNFKSALLQSILTMLKVWLVRNVSGILLEKSKNIWKAKTVIFWPFVFRTYCYLSVVPRVFSIFNLPSWWQPCKSSLSLPLFLLVHIFLDSVRQFSLWKLHRRKRNTQDSGK